MSNELLIETLSQSVSTQELIVGAVIEEGGASQDPRVLVLADRLRGMAERLQARHETQTALGFDNSRGWPDLLEHDF